MPLTRARELWSQIGVDQASPGLCLALARAIESIDSRHNSAEAFVERANSNTAAAYVGWLHDRYDRSWALATDAQTIQDLVESQLDGLELTGLAYPTGASLQVVATHIVNRYLAVTLQLYVHQLVGADIEPACSKIRKEMDKVRSGKKRKLPEMLPWNWQSLHSRQIDAATGQLVGLPAGS